jgi:agmatinase
MIEFETAKKLVMDAEGDSSAVPFNFGALPKELSDFGTAAVVVLPVPYDLTSSYRSGSRMGPKAIIEASRNMELYDDELHDIPARIGVHTLAGLEIEESEPENMVSRVENVVGGLLDAGKIVASLGGEHTITCGVVRAYAKTFSDLSVLHLDAHADLRDSYLGVRYSHACVMRRVRELVKRTSHVGIRSLSVEEADHVREAGIELHDAATWAGSPEQSKQILKELGDGPVYVTCDLDVFDPAYVPSTGTPEPGGLAWNDVIGLLSELITRRRVVGFDVVELCPAAGAVASDFLAAKLVYKIVGYICRRKTAGEGLGK